MLLGKRRFPLLDHHPLEWARGLSASDLVVEWRKEMPLWTALRDIVPSSILNGASDVSVPSSTLASISDGRLG